MSSWLLDEECEEVQEIMQNSGLYNVVRAVHQEVDRLAISAFVKRLYFETNTFYIFIGEINGKNPNDVVHILGLLVVGDSGDDGCNLKIDWRPKFKEKVKY
ncbi:hypothetical protein MKX01_027091 [Papaver californicum]|nr:hypothetical protein MKX01_027091 [Papaver californicum]